MKRLLYILLAAALAACSYDEVIETCHVTVLLQYPEDSTGPYAGASVELKDATASVFISTTDASGRATFRVPAGIYEASSSTQVLDTIGDTWWRYNFNGVRSMIIISPDSSNAITMPLTMSKRRIVH